jgi:beta-glucosidase-like glycosyl hydrolase/CubicO group peptidase (beta-lactamase class C family)
MRTLRAVVLGGVIVSHGSAKEACELIQDLSKESRVPLLFSGDFEAGVAFRLTGTTWTGTAMLLGATGVPALARAAGARTAAEGRALGFHWAFAPVADVNVNPQNPIINVRSFGEDPAHVAKFTAAFVQGLQEGGMLATAKHFPGHGDVASDSHLTMPTVPGDRARLERVELAPFRAAIAAGVGSIMTGHLAVPGLGEDPAVPATLSRRILTGLLRQQLGFDGLIVTDALDMGGVKEKLDPAQACVRALAAGADVLLMPPDPAQARDAVVAAVEAGRVPKARLDEAVLRILRAKVKLGLFEAHRDPQAWQQPTGYVDVAEDFALEVATRGLTLVRDARDLVPLPPAGKTVLVSVLDKDEPEVGTVFAGAVAGARAGTAVHRLHAGSDATAVGAAAAAVAGADLVLAALHVKVRSYSGRIGLPPALAPLLAAVGAHERAVAVSFGDPYLVQALPKVAAYLCAFDGSRFAEQAAARALLGEAPIAGRLPITLPGVAGRGDGLSRYRAPAAVHAPDGSVLPKARDQAANEGFRPTLRQELQDLLKSAVAERVAPGAVAVVMRRGRFVVEAEWGNHEYGESQLVGRDTRWDLASLTKVCATLPVTLRLVAAGRLALDQKVGELLPAFRGEDKETVTVRHLLAHCAGLPPFERHYLTLSGKDAVVQAACATPLLHPPGTKTVYSDLGMIVLMACCERAGGAPFEQLFEREVRAPLGLERTGFGAAGTPVENAPPTEDCAWRKRVVRGEVHDENAFAMGGVSGHAGLFGTALDVARVGCAFLGGGAQGWLPPALVREATTRAEQGAGSTRMLGFDAFAPGGSGGSRLSPQAFGHTGFTGTSLWCDPRTDVCVVLLTNRVHPSRDNKKIDELRRKVYDLVAGAIE